MMDDSDSEEERMRELNDEVLFYSIQFITFFLKFLFVFVANVSSHWECCIDV